MAVVSKPNESLTSIITELKKERAAEDEEYLDDETTTNVKPINHHNTERRLSDVWREVHGKDEWIGLLDQMDPLLRSELIHYNKMAQACYDAFDFDPFSKYCGSCRFTSGKFFECLGMTHRGYQVSRYLFTTSNINLLNFFKKSR
ncbi:hypothetical protein M0R45_009765 [Rubus argutus]|uniref:Uncharacterized protein n=1 Tax=Rubus argutus TaxID=59490 RepID=A0AAW1Y5Q9_RUBAR